MAASFTVIVSLLFLYMQVSCHFYKRTGTSCSFDRRDVQQNTELIPLSSCSKDISAHKSLWTFSGVETETELILARSGIFNAQEKQKLYESGTICPYHRSELGLGWRRNSSKCSIPQEISKHDKRKSDRGINKFTSEQLFLRTGVLIPIGSGKVYNLKREIH